LVAQLQYGTSILPTMPAKEFVIQGLQQCTRVTLPNF